MAAALEILAAIPFDQILIQTINGIVTGMILALVASGLTLIFGIMDVVNFAHGELFMLGAYVGVVTLAATGNFWIALVVASVVIALLGAVIYLTTLRPLLGRTQNSGAFHRPLHSLLSRLSVVPAGDRAALGSDHRGAVAIPQIRHLRHLDPCHHSGSADGPGHGHPSALGAHCRVRHWRR